MLLQRLSEYADTLALPPAFYSPVSIRYIIDLSSRTDRVEPPIDTADPTANATRNGMQRFAPTITRTVSIKPLLLADNASYTLGILREGDKPERVAQSHAAYLALLDACFTATQEPAVAAVIRFLSNDLRAWFASWNDAQFDPRALITFRVDGTFVIDLPAVQHFWSALNDPGSQEASTVVMQCMVCGQQRPVLSRMPGMIKGIMGGQTSGTAMISANANAFESYGLSASQIAPTCANCAERFTKTLNMLLKDPRHRLYIGGLTFVYWLRDPTAEIDVMNMVMAPDLIQVETLLTSIRAGRRAPDADDMAFYAASLSASGARVAVRDWIETSLGGVRQHFAEWFAAQQIVALFPQDEPKFYGLTALAGATVRDLKDLAPTIPRTLLQAALRGRPLPDSYLQQVLNRCRSEQQVTRLHAAAIKLALFHRLEGNMTALNHDHPEAAYHCGRLFALIEDVQTTAIPGIKATIRDRYYGSASITPARIFPGLLRGMQAHLGKLERDRRGAYIRYQKSLEGVLDHITAFPTTLTIHSQGLFALGYYHQRADNHRPAKETAAAQPQM
jgi:CRISPR-associated protein Csd1